MFFDCANEVFEVDGESLVPYGFGLSIEEANGKKLQSHLQVCNRKLLSSKKVDGRTG